MRKINKKSILYAIALTIILAAGSSIWRSATYPQRMQSRVDMELPRGSSRSQVESWLQANHIKFDAIVDNHLAHEKKNYKLASVYVAEIQSYYWIACRTDTYLTFTFNEDRLTATEMSEGSTCM